MIISHRHQFIFLKTSKTAGTSIEIALSRFCGPEDIITPISPKDEKIRRETGGCGPQNHDSRTVRRTLSEWFQARARGKHKPPFYNHMPARKIIQRIEPSVWDNYYRFCVVRNPWDRVISQYYWRNRDLPTEEMPSLAQFLKSADAASLMKKGFRLYTLKGRPAVHQLCYYESLEADLEKARLAIGLPEPLELPNAKGGHRKDKRPYQESFTPQTRAQVARMFRKEIALTGYRF